MWAIGAILWELITEKQPYSEVQDSLEALQKAIANQGLKPLKPEDVKELPADIAKDVQAVILLLNTKDPAARPDADRTSQVLAGLEAAFNGKTTDDDDIRTPEEIFGKSQDYKVLMQEMGDRVNMAERLVKFYTQHNPKKLTVESIEQLLTNFAGNEEELNSDLRKRYKADLNGKAPLVPTPPKPSPKKFPSVNGNRAASPANKLAMPVKPPTQGDHRKSSANQQSPAKSPKPKNVQGPSTANKEKPHTGAVSSAQPSTSPFNTQSPSAGAATVVTQHSPPQTSFSPPWTSHPPPVQLRPTPSPQPPMRSQTYSPETLITMKNGHSPADQPDIHRPEAQSPPAAADLNSQQRAQSQEKETSEAQKMAQVQREQASKFLALQPQKLPTRTTPKNFPSPEQVARIEAMQKVLDANRAAADASCYVQYEGKARHQLSSMTDSVEEEKRQLQDRTRLMQERVRAAEEERRKYQEHRQKWIEERNQRQSEQQRWEEKRLLAEAGLSNKEGYRTQYAEERRRAEEDLERMLKEKKTLAFEAARQIELESCKTDLESWKAPVSKQTTTAQLNAPPQNREPILQQPPVVDWRSDSSLTKIFLPTFADPGVMEMNSIHQQTRHVSSSINRAREQRVKAMNAVSEAELVQLSGSDCFLYDRGAPFVSLIGSASMSPPDQVEDEYTGDVTTQQIRMGHLDHTKMKPQNSLPLRSGAPPTNPSAAGRKAQAELAGLQKPHAQQGPPGYSSYANYNNQYIPDYGRHADPRRPQPMPGAQYGVPRGHHAGRPTSPNPAEWARAHAHAHHAPAHPMGMNVPPPGRGPLAFYPQSARAPSPALRTPGRPSPAPTLIR